jgi:hypothetical protein
MASQLKVDTLTGVTTAGSIVVTGEGNSTTTNLQQGLAKVRYNFELDSGDNGFEGSFNCSSGADNGTGDATITFTNAMANQNYTPTSSSADSDICHTQADRTDGNGSRQTTNFKSRIRDNGGTSRDAMAYVALFGDLA